MKQQGLSVPGPKAPLCDSLEHTGMPAMRCLLAVPAAPRAGLRSVPEQQLGGSGSSRLLHPRPGSRGRGQATSTSPGITQLSSLLGTLTPSQCLQWDLGCCSDFFFSLGLCVKIFACAENRNVENFGASQLQVLIPKQGCRGNVVPV